MNNHSKRGRDTIWQALCPALTLNQLKRRLGTVTICASTSFYILYLYK